jgi:putative cardiolipin synthase
MLEKNILFFLCFFHLQNLIAKDIESYVKEGFRVDHVRLLEGCYLGVATKIYNTEGTLFAEEEGPIDLTDVKMWNTEDLTYAYTLIPINNEKKYPRLFFSSHEKRTHYIIGLREKFAGCRRQNQKKTISNPKGSIHVPNSDERFARPVHENLKGALLTNGKKSWIGRLFLNDKAMGLNGKIDIESLIFMADEAGLYWSQDLIERRRKGVKVRIFLDALSPFLDFRDLTTRENTKKMYHNMMAAGIPVYGFRCSHHHHLSDELWLSARLKSKVYNHRPHEKMWLVNGEYGIVGGLNMGNDYFRLNEKGFNYWRDQDLLLKSKELVADLTAIFEGNIQTYLSHYIDPEKDSCFNPYHPLHESHSYEKFLMKRWKPYKMRRMRNEKKDIQAHARSQIKEYERKYQELGQNTFHWQHISQARAIHNRPKLSELHIENAYLDMLSQAREEVLISNAYFIPSQKIKQKIQEIAQRGVQIKVLTNSYETNDVPPVAVLARHGYWDLVNQDYSSEGQEKGFVSIHEWIGRYSSHQVQGTNHAKFIVVDRKLIFIGSYNLDPRSRDINSEVGVLFRSKKLGQELAWRFLERDLKYARKIYYSDMLVYRMPIPILKISWLKLHGGYQDFDLVDLGKKRFFEYIASISADTW